MKSEVYHVEAIIATNPITGCMNPREIIMEVIGFHEVRVLIMGIQDIQNIDAINSLGIKKDGINKGSMS